MDLKELASGIDPRRHWYYLAKRVPLERYFGQLADGPRNLIDVGAGSGVFSDALIDRFPDRVASVVRVDVNYEAEGPVDDPRVRAGSVEHRRTLPASIDNGVVLLLDVLEHVEDDAAFLRRIVTACRGDNRVFITVPAFEWLWSGHDEFLEHYRRYSLGRLCALARSAGIGVTRAYYLFGGFLPAAWLWRRVIRGGAPGSDMRPVSPALNRLLTAAGRVDATLAPFNKVGGLTAVLEGRIAVDAAETR